MSFLSRLFGSGATKAAASATPGKVVRKRSPLDVSDFLRKAPAAPNDSELMGIINKNYDKHADDAKPNNAGITPEQQRALDEQRDFFTRRVFFDVRYRCGCQGRCMTGVLPCRFPSCFHWRPVVKGGEVFASRMQIEASPIAQQRYGAVLQLTRANQLTEAEVLLSRMIAEKLTILATTDEGAQKTTTTAADKRPTDTTPAQDPPSAPSPKQQPASSAPGSSPAAEEIVALCIWRSALLVNLNRDADGVNALVEVAQVVPQEYAETAMGTAASWACLNDMEARFYRMHDGEYEAIDPSPPVPANVQNGDAPPATSRKANLPWLLPLVVEKCGTNPGFMQHVVSNVFGLEVTAIIARAQTSQESGETIEDPMGTSIVADDVAAFKRLGDTFWNAFETLALSPPLRPPRMGPSDAPDASEGDTPRHVLDAIGRSMLLHHMAASYGRLPGSRKEEKDGGVVGGARTADEALDPLKRMAAGQNLTETTDSEKLRAMTSMPLKQRHCLTRLQELLMVVKAHQGSAAPRSQQ